MLIAIMGDTFDKVTENKLTFTTRTKLQILGDYTGNFLKQENNKMYLFTIEVDQEDADDGFQSWDGVIKRLHKQSSKQFEQLHNSLNNQIAKVVELVEANAKKSTSQDREDAEKQVRMIYANQVTSNHRFNELSRNLKQLTSQRDTSELNQVKLFNNGSSELVEMSQGP